MAIEWGPATKAAAERQAAAIREIATTPEQRALADRAATGEFTDYADGHDCPITTLYKLCSECGLHAIAARVANGEFDATREESDEWARSPSGQEVASHLPLAMRKMFGMG